MNRFSAFNWRARRRLAPSSHFSAGVVFLTLLLAGCASINVKPLDADGKRILPNADAGLRYYLPKPYLLVMRLPADPKSAALPDSVPANPPNANTTPNAPPPVQNKASHPAAIGHAGAGNPPGGAAAPAAKPDPGAGVDSPKTPAIDQSQSPGAGAAVGSTQFTASSPTYVAKLIYLPDYSKPMAITTSTGVGTVNLGAQLQDGWMLTSLQASSDSKTADILTSIASAITGSLGAATGSSAAKKAGPPGGGPQALLPAGLYMFDFERDPTAAAFGAVKQICFVTLFEQPAPGSAFTVKPCHSP
jgi:hypothetical protein